MSVKRVIRLGDKTTHGGEVVSAASDYTIMDKAVAREHDIVTCPIKGHGSGGIIGGDPYWSLHDRAIAIEGLSVAHCGAGLISSCPELGRSYEGQAGPGVGAGNYFSPAVDTSANKAINHERYDEQVRLVSNCGDHHLVGLPYFVETKSGKTYSGHLNAPGELPRIETEGPGEYTVYWGDAALERLTS